MLLAFDGGILRVGFFWDRLNVHTFDSRHRADRRVEGWLRRNERLGGGMGGGMDTYILLTASGRWSHSLPR